MAQLSQLARLGIRAALGRSFSTTHTKAKSGIAWIPHALDGNKMEKQEIFEKAKKDDTVSGQFDASKETRLQIADEQIDTGVSALTGVPEEHIVTRRVRIFRPAKNAMQSGSHGIKQWKIEFDTRERWENQTIGWCSNSDPLSNISMAMTFKSKEDAMDFVSRQGWSYFVDEPKTKMMQPKSYAANFSWDKRSRRSMK